MVLPLAQRWPQVIPVTQKMKKTVRVNLFYPPESTLALHAVFVNGTVLALPAVWAVVVNRPVCFDFIILN